MFRRFPFFITFASLQLINMISPTQSFKLQRVGYTLLATLVSYLGLVAIISVLYALIFGTSDGMDHTILLIDKRDAFQWMMSVVWIPLKWVGISIGLLVASVLMLAIPFIIFRAIYMGGHKLVQQKESRHR